MIAVTTHRPLPPLLTGHSAEELKITGDSACNSNEWIVLFDPTFLLSLLVAYISTMKRKWWLFLKTKWPSGPIRSSWEESPLKKVWVLPNRYKQIQGKEWTTGLRCSERNGLSIMRDMASIPDSWIVTIYEFRRKHFSSGSGCTFYCSVLQILIFYGVCVLNLSFCWKQKTSFMMGGTDDIL